MKIELKFFRYCDWNDVVIVELDSYESFFNFFLENHDKGCIYDVKLKGVYR